LNPPSFIQELMNFISASPTPFHAVENMANVLEKNGFECIHEGDEWDSALTSGSGKGRYYVKRNDSSICAFNLTGEKLADVGVRVIGTHTDSPCLKVKPRPEIVQKGYLQLGVEVYGGALLGPWYDRDLSLAGRVSFESENDVLKNALVNFEIPLAVIPSLAIHLDREANTSKNINPQTDITPILLQSNSDTFTFIDLLHNQIIKQYPDMVVNTIHDYEMSFYDTQKPAVVGLNQEFITSARLDNLLSCFVGLQSLINSATKPGVLVCNDHEEVGSGSMSGAQGTLLRSILERLCPSEAGFAQMINHSFLASVDNAHGVHPNYIAKHDDGHGPLLNNGPVIKLNSSQRYATNSITSALFKRSCARAGVPVQSYVTRNDMACGTTLGPITAAKLGIKAVDVGMPTFAMHSIRELAGVKDCTYMYSALHDLLATEVV